MEVINPGDTSDRSVLKKMNPAMYAEIQSMTDSNQHWDAHLKYYELCKHVKQMTDVPSPPVGDLAKNKVGIFRNVLSADHCKELRAFIDRGLDPQNEELKKRISNNDQQHQGIFSQENFHKNVPLSMEYAPEITSALKAAFSGELAKDIESAYQSNFFISHPMFCRTFPTDKPSGSFAWHRDMTAPTQLHIMIYLTDSMVDGSGGITEFLPAAETKEISETAGYHYRPLKDRTNDIVSLGGPEIRAKVIRPHLKPGDAVAFLSSIVLHRGIPPLMDPRDVLLVVVRPSIFPWHEVFAEFGVDQMIGRGFGHHTLTKHPANP